MARVFSVLRLVCYLNGVVVYHATIGRNGYGYPVGTIEEKLIYRLSFTQIKENLILCKSAELLLTI